MYPALLTNAPAPPPSPGVSQEGHEYLLVRTAAGHKAIVVVTAENGPRNLQYGTETIGKGDQLKVDGVDFPALAATALHAEAELGRTKTITGKAVEEITRIGRPGASSGIGFLAADEDPLSVLKGDNGLVATLGLKHTEYRVDPIAIAVTFSLKSLTEIDLAFDGKLDRVPTNHFTASQARRPVTR